jgi:hypothetical protein
MISEDKVNLCAVKLSVANFIFISKQTPELCMLAVTERGSMLKYVKNQTNEICIAAITNNPYAIEYVKNITPEMYNILKDKLEVFEYIRNKNKTNSYNLISSNDGDCMICYDSNGEWCKLRCGHTYHVNCIKECMKTSKKCPYCQIVI